MKRYRILQTLFISTVVVFLSGCQEYESPVDKVSRMNNDSTSFQKEWVQMKSKSNKLVFKKYFLSDSTVSYEPERVVWTDSTSDPNKIEKFRLLFKNISDGGYYCCPCAHYSISFYNDKNELGEYFVDTTVTKNYAMIYSGNHQTSFEIDLNDWHTFLNDK